MHEKRGSKLLRLLDRYVGSLLLGVMAVLLWVKRLVSHPQQTEPNNCLVVCIGAIGDLILLTEATKSQLRGKQVFMACSKSNLPCANMYDDTYAGIDVIDVRNLLDVYKICKKHNVDTVYDSTQWANIGPIQVGLARFLKRDLVSVGFASLFCSRLYSHVVPHRASLHETANFVNLLAGYEKVRSNAQLLTFLSLPYQQRLHRDTRKVLFHMWPSGTRAYLKEWPEAYWIDLTRYFQSQGFSVYLSGAPADKLRNDAFIRKAGVNGVENIAGVYDLPGLATFVRNEIECAVSVNTGVLHLIASLSVPLIGLHGPTNPERWGPLGSSSVALLPESGNFAYLNYGFEYPSADGDAYALDQLTTQQVISAFEQLKSERVIEDS